MNRRKQRLTDHRTLSSSRRDERPADAHGGGSIAAAPCVGAVLLRVDRGCCHQRTLMIIREVLRGRGGGTFFAFLNTLPRYTKTVEYFCDEYPCLSLRRKQKNNNPLLLYSGCVLFVDTLFEY